MVGFDPSTLPGLLSDFLKFASAIAERYDQYKNAHKKLEEIVVGVQLCWDRVTWNVGIIAVLHSDSKISDAEGQAIATVIRHYREKLGALDDKIKGMIKQRNDGKVFNDAGTFKEALFGDGKPVKDNYGVIDVKRHKFTFRGSSLRKILEDLEKCGKQLDCKERLERLPRDEADDVRRRVQEAHMKGFSPSIVFPRAYNALDGNVFPPNLGLPAPNQHLALAPRLILGGPNPQPSGLSQNLAPAPPSILHYPSVSLSSFSSSLSEGPARIMKKKKKKSSSPAPPPSSWSSRPSNLSEDFAPPVKKKDKKKKSPSPALPPSSWPSRPSNLSEDFAPPVKKKDKKKKKSLSPAPSLSSLPSWLSNLSEDLAPPVKKKDKMKKAKKKKSPSPSPSLSSVISLPVMLRLLKRNKKNSLKDK